MTHAEVAAYEARRSKHRPSAPESQCPICRGRGETAPTSGERRHCSHCGGTGRMPAQGVEREEDLHEQIFAECRRRGWIALHGSMAERTHRTEGEPDFVILGVWSGGEGTCSPHVWFIECKSRVGKLSPAQQAMLAHAAKLGHTVHVVRSFAEFLEVVK